MTSLAAASGRKALHATAKSFKATVVPPAKVATPAAAPKSIWTFPKDHPFAFQMMVATGKTMAADLIVQKVAEGKSWSEIDWKRNAIFVVFGFVYLGGFQWYLMVTKYRQWFPTMDRFAKLSLAEKMKDTAGILDACKMVIFDIVVHLPLLYFPTYYTVKEFVGGSSWNPLDWAKDGITKYSKNAKEDLTAMVQVWGPSDCIQFILPIHMRLPFRHLISFFWTAYVSFTRGKIETSKHE